VKYNILLIGLGQLGSRYLQGLLCVETIELNIDVLEPNKVAYEKGIGVAAEGGYGLHVVKRVDQSTFHTSYDLAIVATSAAPRVEVIEHVAKHSDIRSWILEKVLAQSETGIQRIESSLKDSQVWVNTPRRITSLYKELRRVLGNNSHIEVEVKLPKFALGCNTIHFLDLVVWLSGSSIKNVSIAAATGWYEATRSGYQEFDGEVRAEYSNGSVLRIDNTYSGPGVIKCKTSQGLASIDETSGFSFNDVFHSGRVEFQSELTSGIIERIFGSDFEDFLPTLAVSAKQHRMFLQAVINNKTLGESIGQLVPIT